MTSDSNTPDPARAVWRRVGWAWLKAAAALAIAAVPFSLRFSEPGPAELFLWRQDLPVLAAASVLMLLLMFVPPPRAPWKPSALGGWKLAAFLAGAVFLLGGLGVGVVFEHYTLSLDEFLADFDARIFARGLLLAPVPPEWRSFVPALQPIYMLETPGHVLWASSYLPMAAAFRAAADLVGLRDWVNPAWTALAVLALFGAARKLWPDRPRAALAATALLATSAQVVVMAMTSYAMAPHLALNLVWLWLFLQGRRSTDAAAVGVGAVACGLHQVIFHPLFVAPFILELCIARRWARAGAFIVAYVAIGLFWIAYWGLLYRWAGVPPEQAEAVGAGGFAARVLVLFENFSPATIGWIAGHLIRFATWQNLLITPLALIGAYAGFRRQPTVRALALGVALTLLAMWVLVPNQTHGWGYRYLHGFIGSACLLAVYGWIQLTQGLDAQAKARAGSVFAAICLLCALVLLPLRAWQAHAFSHPHAVFFRAIQASGADVVLVDNGLVGFDMGGFVRNDPLMARGPKVMLLNRLNEDQLTRLCASHSVAVIDGRDRAFRGVPSYTAPWAPRSAALRAHLKAIGCVS